jgi:hypothetical protein
MPRLLRHPASHAGAVKVGRQLLATSMAMFVTERAGSHNVICARRAAIAPGKQMFCRAAEACSFRRRDLVRLRERIAIVAPHREQAVVAAVVLLSCLSLTISPCPSFAHLRPSMHKTLGAARQPQRSPFVERLTPYFASE